MGEREGESGKGRAGKLGGHGGKQSRETDRAGGKTVPGKGTKRHTKNYSQGVTTGEQPVGTEGRRTQKAERPGELGDLKLNISRDKIRDEKQRCWESSEGRGG